MRCCVVSTSLNGSSQGRRHAPAALVLVATVVAGRAHPVVLRGDPTGALGHGRVADAVGVVRRAEGVGEALARTLVDALHVAARPVVPKVVVPIRALAIARILGVGRLAARLGGALPLRTLAPLDGNRAAEVVGLAIPPIEGHGRGPARREPVGVSLVLLVVLARTLPCPHALVLGRTPRVAGAGSAAVLVSVRAPALVALLLVAVVLLVGLVLLVPLHPLGRKQLGEINKGGAVLHRGGGAVSGRIGGHAGGLIGGRVHRRLVPRHGGKAHLHGLRGEGHS